MAAVTAGGPVKVKAYAGAGKTTFLRMASEARPRSRGLYLAFNKDIAQEAQRKFPSNTRCPTVHSLAFGSTSPDITRKLRYPVEPSHNLAIRYGIGPLRLPTTIGKTVELTTAKLGRMVMDGMARFCSSAQAEPQAWHISVDPLIDEELADALRDEAAAARPDALARKHGSERGGIDQPCRLCQGMAVEPPADSGGLHPVR
ncbi:hypothetical protein ACU4GD_15170 [Cupriavidus basilensis]